MSQKSEKYARQLGHRVADVETEMADLRRRQMDSDRFLESLHSVHDMMERKNEKERAKLRQESRQAKRDAEHRARQWQIVAYGAVLAAIAVLIVAIVAVGDAKAAEAPANKLMISEAETSTHSEGVAKNAPVFETKLTQIEDSDKVVEDFENEKIEAALLEVAMVIEDCTVSHYDCCVQCCGKDDGITASGRKAVPGVSVAVDPDVIPLGADVLVDYGDGEIHYYRADDTGPAVKGAHIDLCVSGHEAAEQLGVRTGTVYWALPGEVA